MHVHHCHNSNRRRTAVFTQEGKDRTPWNLTRLPSSSGSPICCKNCCAAMTRAFLDQTPVPSPGATWTVNMGLAGTALPPGRDSFWKEELKRQSSIFRTSETLLFYSSYKFTPISHFHTSIPATPGFFLRKVPQVGVFLGGQGGFWAGCGS